MADPDYFTLVEIRALPDCSMATGATAEFTDAQILAAAAHFTTIVEREVGVPFIPRTFTETLSGTGGFGLILAQTNIRSITSVTADGVAVTVGLLTANHGILRYLDRGTVWPTTAEANVVVVYSAGEFATCPADIKDAVMWATRDRLISQNGENVVDPRQQSMTNDLGGSTVFVLPGEKRPTGYPDLDAVIASYVRHTPTLGFA